AGGRRAGCGGVEPPYSSIAAAPGVTSSIRLARNASIGAAGAISTRCQRLPPSGEMYAPRAVAAHSVPGLSGATAIWSAVWGSRTGGSCAAVAQLAASSPAATASAPATVRFRSTVRRISPTTVLDPERHRAIRRRARDPLAPKNPNTITRLRGLLEVTRLIRDETDPDRLLDAIAAAIAESLGYQTVVLNLYRPAWNHLGVTT